MKTKTDLMRENVNLRVWLATTIIVLEKVYRHDCEKALKALTPINKKEFKKYSNATGYLLSIATGEK